MKSYHISATQLVLLLLMLIFVGNAIELLEQSDNELMDLEEANSTKSKAQNVTNSTEVTDEPDLVEVVNIALLRQYAPPMFGPGFSGNNGFNGNGGFTGNGGFNGLSGCPLCDTSVYGYCSEKMLHDDCCCDFPVPQLRPPQCYYTDCSLLYAKSCYEHMLIKSCCCNNPY